jgi:8-oxo-dGTP diphosphatase
MSGRTIRASGVVLIRRRLDKSPEVLVIHRDRYDDWSFPKGKDEPGETAEETALRELEEETAQRATLLAELTPQTYKVGGGRPKVVRYFVGRPIGDATFKPNSEVDAVKWVKLDKAPKLLTYEYDRSLLADQAVLDATLTGTVFLVRHAHAGDRSRWKGDDRERPLTSKGRRQAAVIADRLSQCGADVIQSSPYLRCVETLEPLAKRLGTKLRKSESLAEGADTDEVLDLIGRSSGMHLALCSHGDIIPDVISRLERRGAKLRSPNGKLEFAKGSIWEIGVRDGAAVEARYVPAPRV